MNGTVNGMSRRKEMRQAERRHKEKQAEHEKAKELLATTDESIGEIALASGYEHQGKFGSVFRDSSGVSPLEYRRLNRKT